MKQCQKMKSTTGTRYKSECGSRLEEKGDKGRGSGVSKWPCLDSTRCLHRRPQRRSREWLESRLLLCTPG